MRKLTKMGMVDICLLATSFIYFMLVVFLKVELAEVYIPTVMNGFLEVTGILVAMTSGLIVFSLRERAHIEHKRHLMISLGLLFFCALTLAWSYRELVASRMANAIKAGEFALLIALYVLFEFVLFFSYRIAADAKRGQR